MIIRDQGIVVGMLDDKSLKLTDVLSNKLADLIILWKREGVTLRGPGEVEEGGRQPQSADREMTAEFNTENLPIFVTQLEIAGFEVQTA